QEIGNGRSGEDEKCDSVLAAKRRVDEDGDREKTQKGQRVWNRQHQRAQVTPCRLTAPRGTGRAPICGGRSSSPRTAAGSASSDRESAATPSRATSRSCWRWPDASAGSP